MITIGEVIKKVELYNPNAVPKVRMALEFAECRHGTQTRASGEPYITHPLRVVELGTERFADEATLCAEALHDVVEDCGVRYKELVELFGIEVANLVEYVTDLPKENYPIKQDLIYANERRLIETMMRDVRAPMIKLDDRVDNMRTLQHKPEESRIKKARDTLAFYVPLAYEFGEQKTANELEDLSFQYVNPEKYREYSEIRNGVVLDREACIKEMLEKIIWMLNQRGISAEVKQRVLNTYGIYKRVIQGDKRLNGIDDLFAIKVITQTIAECYTSLGIVHEAYPISQGNMKDYIFEPKRNEYRSLHTAILPPDENGPIKVFIRTEEMEGIATHGLSYYWHLYEAGARARMQQSFLDRYSLCKTVSEINPDKGDKRFIERLTDEMSSDKINVYTMEGDMFEIRAGSTVVDFAYKIHTEIGDNIIGALVNGVPVNLGYVLRWNDRVEIIVGKQPLSREVLLENASTSTTKNKIKTRAARNAKKKSDQ